MEAFLAVVAFCVGNQCAFFSSTMLFDSEDKCERHVPRMMAELDKQFKQKVDSIGACVIVPIKFS